MNATEQGRVSVDLPPGSFVVERYEYTTHDGKSGVQWLAQVIGDGGIWLMVACKTRREALGVIDRHGTAAYRNAHD